MRYIRLLGMTLFLALGQAAAQEEPSPLYELQEVVIFSQRQHDPPHSFVEITGQEIQERGVTNLAEALELISGIDARTGVKGEVNFDLRGIGQRGVALMIDGRPVYEPYFGTLDISMIPTANIDKIRVSYGPASSLYGANALGGVINITTKSAPSNRAWLHWGSAKHWAGALQVGRSLAKVDLSFSASREQSDGFPLPRSFAPSRNEDGGLRNNADWQRTTIDGRLTYRFRRGALLSLSLGNLDAQKGVPPQVGTDRPRYWRFPDWSKQYVDLSGTFALGSNIKLRAKLYQDRYSNTLVNYQTDAYEDPTWKSQYRNRSSGAHAHVDVLFSARHRFTGGVIFKEDRSKTQSNIGEPWEHFRARTYSLVMQDEYSSTPKVTFTAGISQDWLHTYSGDPIVSFNPQAGVVYRPSASTSLRLLAGKKMRFPTLKELKESRAEDVHLKPEQARSVELGLRQTTGPWQAAIALFRSRATDLINRKDRYSPWGNIDRARLQGLEAEGQIRLPSSLAAHLQYVYLDAIDLATGATLDYRAKHRLLFDADLTLDRLTATFGVSYTGKRLYHDRNSIQSLPDFLTVDLRVARTLSRHLKLTLVTRNLTDKGYEDEAGFPMPGRTWQLGLQYGE